MCKVYVYPNGEVYDTPQQNMSDDYEVRETDFCEVCEEFLIPHYAEPFASCNCGTMEYYK